MKNDSFKVASVKQFVTCYEDVLFHAALNTARLNCLPTFFPKADLYPCLAIFHPSNVDGVSMAVTYVYPSDFQSS